MKYIDEFRNKGLIKKAAKAVRMACGGRRFRFMEVCGTHTMAIFRWGLKDLLPPGIELVSGPGCPVCVTPNEYIDKAVWLSRQRDVTIATFGDMVKIPGSTSSLEAERAGGGRISVVYSTTEALELARREPRRQVIFLGIGFETTAPTVAQSIIEATRRKINNYSVLSGHKTMPEVLEELVRDPYIRIDGFLLPGHVSAIIGKKPYSFLAKKYGKRAVIAGFEPLDILQAILMLVGSVRPKIEVQYTRIIAPGGNMAAQAVIHKVFEKAPSVWRGIGLVKDSGLKIRKDFAGYDAEKRFEIRIARPRENRSCLCGDVLKGRVLPTECRLFGKKCTPQDPVGACMVSSEGACAAYYKYRDKI